MEYAEAVEQDLGGTSEGQIDVNGRGWRAKIAERMAGGGLDIAQGETTKSGTAEQLLSRANLERPVTAGIRDRAPSASPPLVDTSVSRAPPKQGAGSQMEKVFDWEPMKGIGFRGVDPHGLGVRDYLAKKHEVKWFSEGFTSWWVLQDEVVKERIRVYKLTGRFVLGSWVRSQDRSSWQLDRRRKGEAALQAEGRGEAEVRTRGAAPGRLERRGSAGAKFGGIEEERKRLARVEKRADVRSGGDGRGERAVEVETKMVEAVGKEGFDSKDEARKARVRSVVTGGAKSEAGEGVLTGTEAGRSAFPASSMRRFPDEVVDGPRAGPRSGELLESGRQNPSQFLEAEQRWERLSSVGFRSAHQFKLSVREFLARKNEVRWFKDDQPIGKVSDIKREYDRVFRLTGRPIFGNWRAEERRKKRQEKREAWLGKMVREEGAEVAHREGSAGTQAGSRETGARQTVDIVRGEVHSGEGERGAGFTGAVSEGEEGNVVGRVRQKRVGTDEPNNALAQLGPQATTGSEKEAVGLKDRDAGAGATADGAVLDREEPDDCRGGQGSGAAEWLGDGLGRDAQKAEAESERKDRTAGIRETVSASEAQRRGRLRQGALAARVQETELTTPGQRAEAGAREAVREVAALDAGQGNSTHVRQEAQEAEDELGHSGQKSEADARKDERVAELRGVAREGGGLGFLLKQQESLGAASPIRERGMRAETQVWTPRAEREKLTSVAEAAGALVKDPGSDAHVQEGAEALLAVLRSLPASADTRAELAALVERGLCQWAQVDRACRMLAKGFQGDPRDRELLLAGLSVACAMESEPWAMARKSALTTTVTRYLARRGHSKLARAVPDCWPAGEPAGRVRKLILTLMKAGAFDEAVAEFKASLGAGAPQEEVKEAGRELVRGLIHARQLELAMGATLLVGETGNYTPFVTMVQTLAQERKFLEALYLLDVYLKAVATPNEEMLDSLVAQYAEHGYEQTGLEFLDVLRNSGATPHPRTFEVLARAYHHAGRTAFVDRVSDAWLEPGRELLAQGRAHLAAGDVSKAGEEFAQLVPMLPRTGLPFETLPGIGVSLERLLVAQAQAGNTGEAWRVLRWLDVRRRCYAIDVPTPLFEAELREGEGDVIPLMAAFQEHRRSVAGQVALEGPPTRLHKCLFQFLVGKRFLDAAVTVFEASLNDGVTVRLSNVIRLVYNLIDVGQPGVALGILQKCPKMKRDHPGLFHRLVERATRERDGPPSE